MEKIEIVGKPIAWQRVGACGKRFFDRQSRERTAFQWKLKSAYRKQPLNKAISLECTFVFKISESLSRVKKMALVGKPHDSRPDLDNLSSGYAIVGQESYGMMMRK